MKNNLPPRVVSPSGMTLIELSLVVLILMTLIAVLSVGARTWKRGGDRSGCILNQRNLQMSVRCYQNLYGYEFNGQPAVENGTQDIADHLLEKGYISSHLHAQAKGGEPCLAGGTYSASAPNTFPAMGELYIKCSLGEEENHKPDPAKTADW